MSVSIDLKSSFSSSLESRGIPRGDRPQYELVLKEVADHLSDIVPHKWSAVDLERFMTKRMPSLQSQQLPIYTTALAVLSEVLDKAKNKGASLKFEQTDFIADTLRRQVLEDPKVKDAVAKIKGSRGAPRAATRPTAAVPRAATRPSAPRAATRPDDRPLARGHVPEHDDNIGLDPAFARGARTSIRTLALDDSGFGSKRRTRKQIDENEELVFEDSLDAFDAEDLGFAPATEDLGLAPPSDEDLGLAPPSDDDLGLAPPSDDDLGLGPPARDDVGTTASPRDVRVPDSKPSAPVPSAREPDQVLDSPSEVELEEETYDVQTLGWGTTRTLSRQANGSVVIDKRYMLKVTPPGPHEYGEAPVQEMPGGLQEFIESNQRVMLWLVVILGMSFVGFIVHSLLGALLLFGVTAAIGVFSWLCFVALGFDRRPKQAPEPEAAVLEYIAALRMGLYRRARHFLATLNDAERVDIRELLDKKRGPLGRRFNTLAPAALRSYWRSHIQQFDRAEGHPIVKFIKRRVKPDDIDVQRVMFRNDQEAALCVVGGATVDDYALVPVVLVNGVWLVANGECTMQSTRVEALGRLARRHLAGKMDDDALVKAVRRENLTRADVTKARIAGALSEQQAMLLAGRGVTEGQGHTPA